VHTFPRKVHRWLGVSCDITKLEGLYCLVTFKDCVTNTRYVLPGLQLHHAGRRQAQALGRACRCPLLVQTASAARNGPRRWQPGQTAGAAANLCQCRGSCPCLPCGSLSAARQQQEQLRMMCVTRAFRNTGGASPRQERWR
jgi:hypothetical protein